MITLVGILGGLGLAAIVGAAFWNLHLGRAQVVTLLVVLVGGLVLITLATTTGHPEDPLPCPDTAPTEVVACLPPRSR